jgi:hypothetical protein
VPSGVSRRGPSSWRVVCCLLLVVSRLGGGLVPLAPTSNLVFVSSISSSYLIKNIKAWELFEPSHWASYASVWVTTEGVGDARVQGRQCSGLRWPELMMEAVCVHVPPPMSVLGGS